MSAITAKASRKMKKYAVLTREPRCFLGSFDFSWEQRKAIDIADYSKGNGYSKGDLTDAGTPIILYGRLYTKYQFAISEVDTFAFPRNGAVYSQGNEVIVPASGETAEDIARASAVEKSGVLLGGDLNILRPFDFINPLFLALAISNGEPQKELAKKAQGKSVVHIHNTDIQEVTIAYPSRTEQDRIVSVFRQLDNLITLHQRKCANLCSPSQVVFSLLFVTSTFSWEQRKVSDLAEKTYGGGTPTTSNEAYWNGDIPWIQSSDVVDGKLLGVEPRKWITQDGLNNSAAQLIPGNSIAIITRVGVGKLAFIPYSYATSQDFLSLSKLNAEPLFTVYACYKKLQSELNAVQGTSIKGITKDELLAKNIMVPRYAEQQQIGAFFKQLDNLITLHQRECISFTGRADRLILTANKKRTTSSWEQRKLGDVVKEITRNDPESEAPIMMITANNGFIEQSERYAFNNAGESLKKYILLKKGELAYNHGASKLRPYGSCFALTTAENARIPFVYHCFSAENQNAEFMSIELNGAEIENQLRKIVSSGARMDGLLNISFDEYTSVSVLLPGTEEQDRIADFFRHLDNLITLHQRKPFLMKWRTSDANRNQTNRLVL